MRSGYNSTRRNRNIGTVKQGHGQNNKMVVPQSWHTDRLTQQTIGKFRKVERCFAGRRLVFFVEETSGGCTHACSVSDVCEIFKNIPFANWAGLETIVFRQPSKKQRILNPVWGRMYYFATIGRQTGKYLAEGPAIFLEAQPISDKIVWPTSLAPELKEELQRLEKDGHEVSRVGRKYTIQTSEKSVRQTQLFRTVIHEVGHWVDYLEKVERPGREDITTYDALQDRYFSRPRQEREAFAHRYADELSEKLKKFGLIPFDRIEDEGQ